MLFKEMFLCSMIGLKTASNGLGGKPWFTSDLKFDHCGFNNPCYSAFLAPKCFLEPFKRKEGRKEERKKAKSTCRSACSFLAADNKIMKK